MLFDSDLYAEIQFQIEADKAEAEAYAASAMGRVESSIESAKAAFWESRRGLETSEWNQAMRLDPNIIPF